MACHRSKEQRNKAQQTNTKGNTKSNSPTAVRLASAPLPNGRGAGQGVPAASRKNRKVQVRLRRRARAQQQNACSFSIFTTSYVSSCPSASKSSNLQSRTPCFLRFCSTSPPRPRSADSGFMVRIETQCRSENAPCHIRHSTFFSARSSSFMYHHIRSSAWRFISVFHTPNPDFPIRTR